MKSLVKEFRNSFLPDLENRSPTNYFVNEQNRENIIIDFLVICNLTVWLKDNNSNCENSMKDDINKIFNKIFSKIINEYNKNSFENNLFLHFIASIYSKINIHSHEYLLEEKKENRKNYQIKIILYMEQLKI